MKIKRYFTRRGYSPYHGIEFKRANSIIRDAGGAAVFSMEGVTVPAQWSQIATDVLAQRYFRKTGVPNRTRRIPEHGVPVWLQRSEPDTSAPSRRSTQHRQFDGERDARQVFDRMTGVWTYWGWKQGYFDNEADAESFRDELRFMLASQMAAPNSPQWFNAGLHWAYGIAGESHGHYFWDSESGEAVLSTSAYEHPQLHACFIQSVEDDLIGRGGIMDLWQREARLFKHGSGSGTNFSSLRAKGEPLSGGGISSGVMSFLKLGDSVAGTLKAGGTTRRAAKMVLLDVGHPEVEPFIDWKMSEENKVISLVVGSNLCADVLEQKVTLQTAERFFKPYLPAEFLNRAATFETTQQPSVLGQRYSYDWESESYLSVSGQNSNNSIRVSDEFMNSAKDNRTWSLRFRTSGQVAKELPATTLLTRIAYAAWACGDPGMHFQDTISSWHTCATSGEIRASNPCSEYMFLDDTACNLASLNLVAFLPEEGMLDIDGLVYASRLWTIVLDVSVGMAQYPSKRIAEQSLRFRTLGLGYANLGGLLLRLGVAYGSREGRSICAALTALVTGAAYEMSADLASNLTPFDAFEENADSMLRVIRNHVRAAEGCREGYEQLNTIPEPLDESCCSNQRLVNVAREVWRQALSKGTRYGFRNAQVSAIAPTGTIGLIMDVDTTGIEPEFALMKYKSMAGGSTVRMVSKAVDAGLSRLGYSSEQIDEIKSHILTYGTVCGSVSLRKEHTPVFECAVPATANDRALSIDDHVAMVAAAQPFVSGAVSKTINMPSDATVSDCLRAFWQAWQGGLKAVALYRDGSKFSQPLSTAYVGAVPISPPIQAPSFSGLRCAECGSSLLIRDGTCFTCQNCGRTTACG